jgi:hypothetical protein
VDEFRSCRCYHPRTLVRGCICAPAPTQAHCGHCVSTGPEVLAREIPLFATRVRRLPTNNRINVALKWRPAAYGQATPISGRNSVDSEPGSVPRLPSKPWRQPKEEFLRRNPITEATGYFGGIAIHMCTWSGSRCPSMIWHSFCPRQGVEYFSQFAPCLAKQHLAPSLGHKHHMILTVPTGMR